MSGELLNENQQRRLGTHLGLLVSDLETLAAAPELRRAGSPYTMVQAAIDAALRAVEGMRAALSLPADRPPTLKRRVAAVAEVWAARIEDLRARRLQGYGAVHPGLGERLDPRVDEVRRRLEALAVAAALLLERAT